MYVLIANIYVFYESLVMVRILGIFHVFKFLIFNFFFQFKLVVENHA